MFKALTGGDCLSAERKFHNAFQFESFARLLFSANHPPRSVDSSWAFYRRWLVVPFDRSFEGRHAIRRDVLRGKLCAPEQLSGVLNLALEVWPQLHARGFTQTASTLAAGDTFREVTDPLAAWLQRAVVCDPDAIAPISEMFAAYNQDARENGRPPYPTETVFSRSVKRLKPELQKTVFRRIAGTRKRCWVGIGLKR